MHQALLRIVSHISGPQRTENARSAPVVSASRVVHKNAKLPRCHLRWRHFSGCVNESTRNKSTAAEQISAGVAAVLQFANRLKGLSHSNILGRRIKTQNLL